VESSFSHNSTLTSYLRLYRIHFRLTIIIARTKLRVSKHIWGSCETVLTILKEIGSLIVRKQLCTSYRIDFIFFHNLLFLGLYFQKEFSFFIKRKREVRERERERFAREAWKEERKLVTVNGIENSTTSDASRFFVAVGCVRCMDVPGRKFRHPGDRMNSVNKKCALELGAPVHTRRARGYGRIQRSH